MAAHTVLATLQDKAEIMLFSEAILPGHGWDYTVLEEVVKNPDMTPSQVAKVRQRRRCRLNTSC